MEWWWWIASGHVTDSSVGQSGQTSGGSGDRVRSGVNRISVPPALSSTSVTGIGGDHSEGHKRRGSDILSQGTLARRSSLLPILTVPWLLLGLCGD